VVPSLFVFPHLILVIWLIDLLGFGEWFGVLRTASLLVISLFDTVDIWMDGKVDRIDIFWLYILLINYVAAFFVDLFVGWLCG
jgi:hypothetical protein